MIMRNIALFCASLLPMGLLTGCTQVAVSQPIDSAEYSAEDIGCAADPLADDAEDEHDLYSTTLMVVCT